MTRTAIRQIGRGNALVADSPRGYHPAPKLDAGPVRAAPSTPGKTMVSRDFSLLVGRRNARRFLALLCLGCVLGTGCAQNTYTLQSQVQALQQERQLLAQRTQELQTRADALDRDNQETKALLAQEKQQARVFQDESAALREQLRTTANQLAQEKQDRQQSDARALMASSRRPVGASIAANSSLLGDLPKVTIPGVEVRQDGDVVRIELPCEQVFVERSATLKPGSERLLLDTAARVLESYPEQMIGVEGHTDSDPVAGFSGTNLALSTSQALAVHGFLITQARVSESHLFVVGHGGNHPVVSNATPAGKQRNRRVELVIYPDKAPR